MPALTDSQLQALLQDDTPSGDLTTHTLAIGAQAAHLEFRARQPVHAHPARRSDVEQRPRQTSGRGFFEISKNRQGQSGHQVLWLRAALTSG